MKPMTNLIESRGQSRSQHASITHRIVDAASPVIAMIAMLLILASSAFAQAVSYSSAVYTVSGQVPPGALAPVLAVPGSTVNVCLDSVCNTRATTYTGFMATTTCPAFAQLISGSGTGTCVSLVDNTGDFFFWVLPGNYYYQITTPNGTTRTYPISIGGGSAGSSDWLTLANRPVLDTRNYNFTPQTPGGTINPGSVTILLSPVPLGVNGTDKGHSLYIQSGSGTAEAFLINGGTAVSGATSGTVTGVISNSHSGSWTIGSDSCGIGEAVNIAQGVTVLVPTGTCVTHSPITITKSFERLTGQGGAGQLGGGTVINNLAGTNGIVMNGALSGALDGVEVDHLQLESSASTGGYALTAGGLSFGRIHDISVEPYPNGLALIAATEGTRYNTLTFQAIAGDGININVGDNGAGRFDDTIVGCNRQSGTNGIHALSGHGIMMSYLYVVGCANGWQSDSSSGEVSYVDLVNAYFDTGTAAGNGINLVPTSTGSVFVFRGTHVTAAGFTGIGIHIGTGGTVGGVHLTDFTATINTHQGGLIEGGTDITFQNSQFIGNSNGSVGTFNGLDITGGNYINIEGSSLGAYDGQIENQGIGLNISGTTNNLVIKHNQLNNNTVASMQDTSTGIFRFVSDNPGIGIPTIASATSLNLGTLDATTYDLTGTTTITSITPVWDNRQVTFIKADSGSITLLNATLSQNGSVTCTYVNGASQWFCAAGGGGGGGTPCVTTALSFQYNNAGSFGCTANASYSSATGVFSINQLANGNDIVNMTRFTDTTPTGFFHHWKNAAGTDVASLDVLGNFIGAGFTSQGTNAGRFQFVQGPASWSTGFTVNGIGFYAPTSVPIAYQEVLPSADALGALSSDGNATPGHLSWKAFNGTGNICLTTNCALVTPNIGTPSAGNASNLTNLPITLTTTGSSGPAIYTQGTNTLNIPQYSVGGGSVGACVVTGGGTATLTVTVSAATNVCPLTLSANATTVNISGGGSAGDSIAFAITQGGSIFTMAAPTAFTPWPGPSRVASKIANFTCWNQDGTNWSCGAATSTATNGQCLETTAPGTPTGTTIFNWCDTTNARPQYINPAAVIFGPVQDKAAVTNNVINSIVAGIPTLTQLGFSNLSGSATCLQMPAFTGDVTTVAGNCANTLATVNAGPGTFRNPSAVTVNAKGLVTSVVAGAIGPNSAALTDFLCNTTSTVGPYACTTNIGTTETTFTNAALSVTGGATANTVDGTHTDMYFSTQLDWVEASGNVTYKLYACSAFTGSGAPGTTCTGATALWISAAGAATAGTNALDLSCHISSSGVAQQFITTCSSRAITQGNQSAVVASLPTTGNWYAVWSITFAGAGPLNNAVVQLKSTDKRFF